MARMRNRWRNRSTKRVAEVRKALGSITILINNAAVENFTPFADIEDALWDRLMNVNLKGTYRVTQSVLPDMIAGAQSARPRNAQPRNANGRNGKRDGANCLDY